jgi:hypothetical protein
VTPHQARSRVAHAKRYHPDADHTDLERDLAAANLEAYIRRVVDQAPPLTSGQIERLRALLPALTAEADGEDRACDTDGGAP